MALVALPSGTGESHGRRETEIVQTVRAMAEVRVVHRRRRPAAAPTASPPVPPAAAGHPGQRSTSSRSARRPAVRRRCSVCWPACPRDLAAAVVVVQHITPDFQASFVSWLGDATRPARPSRRGRSGAAARPRLRRAASVSRWASTASRHVVLRDDPPENGLRPAVSYLFRSVATVAPRRTRRGAAHRHGPGRRRASCSNCAPGARSPSPRTRRPRSSTACPARRSAWARPCSCMPPEEIAALLAGVTAPANGDGRRRTGAQGVRDAYDEPTRPIRRRRDPDRRGQPHAGRAAALLPREERLRRALRPQRSPGARDARRAAPRALVVSDIVMPEIDGYELCRRLRQDAATAEHAGHPADRAVRVDRRDQRPGVGGHRLPRQALQRALAGGAHRAGAGQRASCGATRPAGDGVDVFFGGNRSTRSSRAARQSVDFLLSSFEDAIEKNVQLNEANSQLKDALQKISTLETRYQKLMEFSPAALLVVGRDGVDLVRQPGGRGALPARRRRPQGHARSRSRSRSTSPARSSWHIARRRERPSPSCASSRRPGATTRPTSCRCGT